MIGFLRSLFGKREASSTPSPLKDSLQAELRRAADANQAAAEKAAERLWPAVVDTIREEAAKGNSYSSYSLDRVREEHRVDIGTRLVQRLHKEGIQAWFDGYYIEIELSMTPQPSSPTAEGV